MLFPLSVVPPEFPRISASKTDSAQAPSHFLFCWVRCSLLKQFRVARFWSATAKLLALIGLFAIALSAVSDADDGIQQVSAHSHKKHFLCLHRSVRTSAHLQHSGSFPLAVLASSSHNSCLSCEYILRSRLSIRPIRVCWGRIHNRPPPASRTFHSLISVV